MGHRGEERERKQTAVNSLRMDLRSWTRQGRGGLHDATIALTLQAERRSRHLLPC